MDLSCQFILVIITLVALSIGAYQDIKTRYTSNLVWLTQGISGLLVVTVCGILQPYSFLELFGILINFASGLILGFLFYSMGIWGGGDSKALIALSFSSPVIFSFIPMTIPLAFALIPLFLILANFIFGLVLTIVPIFILNIFNYFKFRKWFINEHRLSIFTKITFLVTAFQVDPKKLSSTSFLDPAEEFVDNEWVSTKQLFVYNEEDEVLEQKEKELRQSVHSSSILTKREFVWVRAQIPGIVYFWLAYVIWLLWGSILIPFLQLIQI